MSTLVYFHVETYFNNKCKEEFLIVMSLNTMSSILNYININVNVFLVENVIRGSVVAERLRAPNSNSGVSDQQSVGSNPQP